MRLKQPDAVHCLMHLQPAIGHMDQLNNGIQLSANGFDILGRGRVALGLHALGRLAHAVNPLWVALWLLDKQPWAPSDSTRLAACPNLKP